MTYYAAGYGTMSQIVRWDGKSGTTELVAVAVSEELAKELARKLNGR